MRREFRMTGTEQTLVRQVDSRQCVLETPAKSWLFEDVTGEAAAWVAALSEANKGVSDIHDSTSGYSYANGNGPSHDNEEKRKSKLSLGR